MNKYSTMCVVAIIMLSSIGLVAAQDGIKCAWEPCGTKVVQADIDAVYRLTLKADGFDPQFIFYDYLGDAGVFDDSDTMYIDMNGDGIINPGDVRLLAWHNVPTGEDRKYEPNTKVLNDDDDALLGVVNAKQDIITYRGTGPNAYSLSSSVYLDVDGTTDVTEYDIRLTEVTMSGVTYSAYTTVEEGDKDYFYDLYPIGTGNLVDLLGFIDSDCSETWTCPDKLYLQQPWNLPNGGEHLGDIFVTIGDLRIYIPQDAIDNENWPSCGTKVEQGDIDAVYVLRVPTAAQIGYHDMSGDVNVFDAYDTVYVDMDGNNKVNPGDVRLTPWHNDANPKYPANTKVANDDDQMKAGEFLVIPDPILVSYYNENSMYGFDLSDPIYLDMDNSSGVSTHDVRLTAVVIVNGPTYPAFSTVKSSDVDRTEGRTLQNIGSGNIADLIGYIDSDCTGSWTCPDKLYLEQPPTRDGMGGDQMVSIGDLRLYIPQGAIDNENWPSCGTRVEQCDIDAVYVTKNIWVNGEPTFGYYDYTSMGTQGNFDNGDTLYVDMDNSNTVTEGDIRLLPWHNLPVGDERRKLEPNTKVYNEADVGTPLVKTGMKGKVMFWDQNLDGYDLGDPVYVNMRDPGAKAIVSQFDVRLVAVDAGGVQYEKFTTVVDGDNDQLESRKLSYVKSGEIGELISFIDSDCSNSWTCPDKLYLDQQFSWVVSIGDLRLYIPPGEISEEPSICAFYDATVNGGDGDTCIDKSEVVSAILDYLPPVVYPFGVGGEYEKSDLVNMIVKYLSGAGCGWC